MKNSWRLTDVVKANHLTSPPRRSAWPATRTCVVVVPSHPNISNPGSSRAKTIREKLAVKAAMLDGLLKAWGWRDHPALPVSSVHLHLESPHVGRWDGTAVHGRAKYAQDMVALWLGCDDKEGRGVNEWFITAAKGPAVTVTVTITRTERTSAP